MSTQSGPETVSFPGLNGIRAVAALSVLVSHTYLDLDAFGLKGHGGIEIGGAAVTMFFTLSGFLITYLLLVEKKQYGRLALGKFYMRRILRIWPLYFVYIALVVILFGTGRVPVAYLALYVIFFANIPYNLAMAPAGLHHLWSIGIEEQFYAFWPLVVQRVRNLATFLCAFIVLFVTIRVGAKFYSVHVHQKLPFSIIMCMRFDCMATGALFAVLYQRRSALCMTLARSGAVPVVFWGLAALGFTNHLGVFSILHPNAISLATGLFIIHEIEKGSRTTVLENPVMSFLGKISFGIYVYHPLVIMVLAVYFKREGLVILSPLVAVLLVGVTTVVLAWLSYERLEKPFLRIKNRFARVPSRSP